MPPFVLGKNTKLRAKGIARRILWCCASNFNSIEDALQKIDDFITERNRPFYANPWGIEFWSYYVSGKDVLEGDVSDSKIEKIAWITTTAADTISTKEDEGVSFNGHFLLYLVPSLDKVHGVGDYP
ncbi:hypothetical protein ACS0TY_002105 [Phlomoides rotata]